MQPAKKPRRIAGYNFLSTTIISVARLPAGFRGSTLRVLAGKQNGETTKETGGEKRPS